MQIDKFDQFWAINKKLMDTSGNESEFKYIPFRLYCTDDGPFIQKLVKPFTDDKQQKSLINLLQEVYPSSYEKGLCNSLLKFNISQVENYVYIRSKRALKRYEYL